jgi:hypothetical protein
MEEITMKRIVALTMLVVFAGAIASIAAVERVTVPGGSEVVLAFDQELSSKTAKVGDIVRLHVRDDVFSEGKLILSRGTPVTGVISKVDKRKRYGVNAEVMISLNPVQSTFRQMLPIEPRTAGKALSGEKTGKAAAATAGGAIVLGPVGLAGGYFIHGKSVSIKPGDTFDTEISKTKVLTRQIRIR